MKLGEKRTIQFFLLEFGVAFSISLAGFLFTRSRNKGTRKPSLPPPKGCSSDCSEVEKGGGRNHYKDDQHDETSMPRVAAAGNSKVESEFDSCGSHTSSINNEEACRLIVDTSKSFRGPEKDEFEQEVRHLRNMVRILRERERSLEVQLLEYYGLKEQETAVMELQNRLKINNMEAKLFTLKIESLQADNRRLQTQVADHAKVMSELESARSKIKLLKRKLKFEAEQNREQIIALQKRVSKLQEQECKAVSDKDYQSKLHRISVLENEANELRKSNMKLEQENSELEHRLECTQVLANSVLEDAETEAVKEMNATLRQENETLSKELEQLKADRCTDVEEVVYLKWINACLRYELRNFQAPAGKTVARDLSKTLSPKSEEKAKQLILDYANTDGIGNVVDMDSEWSSSQASSYITDSEHVDDTSLDSVHGKKTKVRFFSKLRNLIRGKDSSHHDNNSHQNQPLSTDKSGYYEDVSPQFSSSMSLGNNVANSVASRRSSSLESADRVSLDIPRPRKGGVRPSRRSYSDFGSSFEKLNLSRESLSEMTPGNQSEHEHERDLVKFAEALKDTPGRRRRSYGSP